MAAGVDVAELKVGMPVELVLEPLYAEGTTEKVVWKWKPLGVSREPGGRGPGRRHAPLGQVGPQLRRVRRARGPRGTQGRRRSLAGRAVHLRGGDHALRLPGLRRRGDLCAGARLAGRAGQHLLRRLRLGFAGARGRARADPRRRLRRGPRRRRRHDAQGVPRADGGLPARGSGLGAFSPRHHQSDLLCVVCAPAHGAVRRHGRGLHRGQAQERRPRRRQSECPLPQALHRARK